MSESSTAAEPHNAPPGGHLAHEAHGALAAFESLEGLSHLFGGGHAAPGPFSLLGLPLGGLTMARGIDEVRHGEWSQGGLDIGAGGLGMASDVVSMMTLIEAIPAAPMLGTMAGLAGLASYGNEDAQANGWYGKDRDGNPNTLLGGIRDKAADGQALGADVGHTLLGNNFVGDVAGGMLGNTLGALGGVNQSMTNTTTAIGAGALKVGGNEVDFVREHPLLGSILAPGVSSAVSAYDNLSAMTR